MSCLTAALSVCSVLLQHCMFFLTAALYVRSCRSVFPVLLQPVKSQGVKISGHLLAIHLPRSVIHDQSRCGKNISRPSLGETVAPCLTKYFFLHLFDKGHLICPYFLCSTCSKLRCWQMLDVQVEPKMDMAKVLSRAAEV